MKSILITGCSSGIGAACAQQLKQRGYRVIASARQAQDVSALQQSGLEAVQLDVNDSLSIRHAMQKVAEMTDGRLDALFNNAGFLQAGAIEDLDRNIIRAQFETNVFGLIEVTQAALQLMRKRGQGRIIQNSSILGLITLPYYGAYNASKFAVEGFSNTLRQELRGTEIYVSIINPGPVASELRNKAYHHYQHAIQAKTDSAHKTAYQELEQHYFAAKKEASLFTQSPTAVTYYVVKALESRHPKAHYVVGVPSKSIALLKRLLPDRLFDFILRVL